jgi:hypothetical protein
MIGLGRKRAVDGSNDSDTEELETGIKRCRVSSSPGLLRLKNDIRDFPPLMHNFVLLEETSDTMSILIRFLDDIPLGIYRYSVAKRYPHERPVIQCLSRLDIATGVSFLTKNGVVTLPEVNIEWTGMSTLADAVSAIARARIAAQASPDVEMS